MKFIRTGDMKEGFEYPVVNEREVRATAGIMLLIGIITLFLVTNFKMYLLIKIVVPIFFLEFFLKVTFGPQASLFSLISGLIVKKQEPEYVGAIQKQFAWALGLIMAGAMMIVVFGYGMKGIVPLSICLTCLTLMWIESVFGICVGCKIYWGLVNNNLIRKPKHRPRCSGGSCSL